MNKVLSSILAIFVFVMGIAFINGGYFSQKYGMFISAGEYNQILGVILILISIVVSFVGLRHKK